MATAPDCMRRLAAAVIAVALNDYQEASEKLKDSALLRLRANPEAFRREMQKQRRECFYFLTQDSVWHQILGLNPESVLKRLRQGRMEYIRLL